MFRKFKGHIMGFMAALVIMSIAGTALAVSNRTLEVIDGVKVQLNGRELSLQNVNGEAVDAFVHEGTTYVPVRAIGEALGCKVTWDETADTAKLVDYESLFEAKAVYSAEDDVIYAYRLYLPKGYDKNKEYPVVVALHGGGSRGTDNVSQLTQSAVRVWVDLQLSGEIEDVIVVAPQQHPKYGFFLDSNCVITVLDDVEAQYSVNKDRIYLTGSSMGGMGSWSEAAKYTDRFAASLASAGVYPDARYTFPVGGVAPAFDGDVLKVDTPAEEYEAAMKEYAQALKDYPIWMFHSENDTTAPVSYTQLMERYMKDVNATQCTFTYFDESMNISHGGTFQAILDEYPEAIDWLLSQHK